MTCVLEFNFADIFSATIDKAGKSSHPCASTPPHNICEVEANALKRFDFAAFERLSVFGVQEIKPTLSDLDEVGKLASTLARSNLINTADDNFHLYKHSVAKRTDSNLLIAGGHMDNIHSVEISRIFGHLYQIY